MPEDVTVINTDEMTAPKGWQQFMGKPSICLQQCERENCSAGFNRSAGI